MNRLRERARGRAKHGSCGLGIGEARHFWLRYGKDAVTAGDLRDPALLREKLALLRDRLLLDLQELPSIDGPTARVLYETPPAREADALIRAARPLQVSAAMPRARTVVFEGAQGILLDEYFGFHPYTTWSTVTSLHALELVEEYGFDEVEVLGVTRAYATRHGAGPLPTHDPVMTARLSDPGNPANAWQDSLRAGPLDLVLLAYAARSGRIDGIVVNGLDHLPGRFRVCRAYRDPAPLETPRCLREQERLTRILEAAQPVYEETTEDGLLGMLEEIAPVRMVGRGPSSADRTLIRAAEPATVPPR